MVFATPRKSTHTQANIPKSSARTMPQKSECHANFLAPVTRHNGLCNASQKHPYPSMPKIKMPHQLPGTSLCNAQQKHPYTRSSQDHAPKIKMSRQLPSTNHSAQWSLQRLATAPIPERTYPSAPARPTARTMRPKSKCHANFLAPVTRHNGLCNAWQKHLYSSQHTQVHQPGPCAQKQNAMPTS